MTLIDTSSWVEALWKGGDETVRKRVQALLMNGEAAWCDMVRLELWNGASGESEKRKLRLFEKDLPCFETTSAAWDLAIQLAVRTREAGLTVPSTDLLILACARHHAILLEHSDHHFTEAERILR